MNKEQLKEKYPLKQNLHKGNYTVVLNPKGYVCCPECGRRTRVKALPNTMLENFPLWCEHCHKQFIIDY